MYVHDPCMHTVFVEYAMLVDLKAHTKGKRIPKKYLETEPNRRTFAGSYL